MKRLCLLLICMFTLFPLISITVPDDEITYSDPSTNEGIPERIERYKKVVFNTSQYGGTDISFGFRTNASSPLESQILNFTIGDMGDNGLIEASASVEAFWDFVVYSSDTSFTFSIKMGEPLNYQDNTGDGIPWRVEWLSGNETKILDAENREELLVEFNDKSSKEFSDDIYLRLFAYFDPDNISLEEYQSTLSLVLETT